MVLAYLSNEVQELLRAQFFLIFLFSRMSLPQGPFADLKDIYEEQELLYLVVLLNATDSLLQIFHAKVTALQVGFLQICTSTSL